MALIPLKDSISVTKPSGTDDWGQPIPGVSNTYDCRIDEGTKLVRNQNGAEVVVNTHIMIGGGVAVSYDDDVTWTDSTGVERTKNPVSIGTIKDIASKVLFTEVSL
jgi:hypothetical protein